MSGSQDIREWARGKGYAVGTRGGISSWIRDEYEAEHEPPPDGTEPDEEPMLMVPDEAPEASVNGSPVPQPVEEKGPAERPPQAPPGPRRGILSREPRKPRQPKPGAKKHHPRVSLENLISFGYGGAATLMQRAEHLVPVGRVMSIQAPMVGYIADEKIKGTAADRFLQPLARMSENGEAAAAVAGPPLITLAITYHPEWYPALAPLLKMTLQSWFAIAGPAADKMKRRAAALESESPVSDAELEGMIQAIFSDINTGAVPSSQEEANIRKARGDQPPA